MEWLSKYDGKANSCTEHLYIFSYRMIKIDFVYANAVSYTNSVFEVDIKYIELSVWLKCQQPVKYII
jgi:hypothetical protein